MPDISTLSSDVRTLLSNVAAGVKAPVDAEGLARLAANVAQAVHDGLTREVKDRKRGEERRLYMSELGTPCTRQLWYKLHTPGVGDKLEPSAVFKFMYGSVIEEIALYLAQLAGHEVHEQQKSAEIKHKGWTVRGRRDATIDGVCVDVKSASPYGYDKIVNTGLTDENDSFGYRAQVSGYAYSENPEAPPDVGILAVDKQNGHIKYTPTDYIDPIARLDDIIPDLELPEPPSRTFAAVTMANGNQKLCTECSYCAYKNTCWSEANDGKGLIRAEYAAKHAFMVKIVKPLRVTTS